jgi:hypothetical protein
MPRRQAGHVRKDSYDLSTFKSTILSSIILIGQRKSCILSRTPQSLVREVQRHATELSRTIVGPCDPDRNRVLPRVQRRPILSQLMVQVMSSYQQRTQLFSTQDAVLCVPVFVQSMPTVFAGIASTRSQPRGSASLCAATQRG